MWRIHYDGVRISALLTHILRAVHMRMNMRMDEPSTKPLYIISDKSAELLETLPREFITHASLARW